MALLPILHFPDPRLRIKAAPVAVVDDALRKLTDDMFETLYAAPGIGLAAPQIAVSKRVVVIDISLAHDQPLCLINPEILSREGEIRSEEGCLSVPDEFEVVGRASKIELRALGRDGQPLEMEAEGLLAICIQHEVDHLDGRLFVDYLSTLKKQRLQKRLAKQEKMERVSRHTL